MTRKQIGAVLGAVVLAVIAPLLVLALLHGADRTAQAQVPDPYVKDSMPDFGQHSKSWCWVGAASNSFWWFAQTGGYPELMDVGDEYIEPLSRDATPGAPDNYDPHDFDKDGVTNEPDGVPDWFDYNDRPENTGPVYDGTCGDYADNDGDTLYDFTGLIFDPAVPGPRPPDPDCTSPWLGGAPPAGDDDGDTVVDEDPINGGVDEDGDSLVDEDPIDFPPFDDDLDGLFDEDPPAYDDDGDGPADEDGVVGYRTLLKKVAETVWRDTNQNGLRDPGERSYVYSEAVEKWDYLIGLQAYIDDHQADLQVHDLLHPNFTGNGITAPTDENRGAMSWSRPSQLTAQAAANSGVSQVVRIPTLDDYKTELSRSQDVLVWMCRKNAQFDWYCHVVTGQGYDTTVGGAHGNGIITVSDPWTHASVHDDGWLNQGGGPDHNNDYKHPDPEPYDDCDVFTPGSNAPVEDFDVDCGGTVWKVVDLIFISPPGPDVKIVSWSADMRQMVIPVGPEIFNYVREDKHNNGPGDTDSSATWTAVVSDPGAVNVRWHGLGGDTCTLDGTPVDCTTAPTINDLEFEVSLPQSVIVPLMRELGVTCNTSGEYTITLINEEWPIDVGGDRDPSNNVATTTVFVNCTFMANQVDKEVLDIVFDYADSYPDEGTELFGGALHIRKSENTAFSVTSEDVNWGPDEPIDAEISFYAFVPEGCSGRWYDPDGHFPYDIQTIGGDYNQMSSGTVWFPPAKEAGPVWLDLHFQTAEYGLTEPVGQEQRYTRFFEIHCYDAAFPWPFVFTFCNRADPKFDTDPDPLNNLLCEDLNVYSLHNADIKVLTFYSDPAPPFQFVPSTYNVISMIEDKHNNGPQDAWSSVWWWILPIEDRDDDGIPDINVRWEAQVGDICFYQGAWPGVACGEGDGPGTGGSADGLPSLTGDNCQDDIDNDGDGTCDINGCTAYPGMGDADCGDVDEIYFWVDLPQSADTQVQRDLKLHCKVEDPLPYTLTLWNDEYPGNPDNPDEPWSDPDPDNNHIEIDLDVTCASPHYKVYDIYDEQAPPVGQTVSLETQFGTQSVQVYVPVSLMAPAIKYDTATGDYLGGGLAAPHLKCYNIATGHDPPHVVNLTTQFGTHTNLEVTHAGRLCVPALKGISPDPPEGELPTAPHYVQYSVTAVGPLGATVDLETQFGLETGVEVTYTWALLAPALKTIPPGPPEGDLTAPHLLCYNIATGHDPPHTVNLQTQFGLETDVDVGRAWWMCVPAIKEIVVQEADKEVTDIEFRDPTGQPIDPAEIEILKSQDYQINVTSVEYNWGPDQPVDAEISFYANIPAGCEGQWVPDTFDILTVDGDPSIPSSGTPTTPGMVAGLRTVDLHFQTLEYGIDEPPQSTLAFTRDFQLHCSEADAFNYVFTFCNRADVKAPDVDPDLTNNLHCEDLFVTSLHNADIESVSWTAPSPQTGYVGVPFTITVDEDKHNHGPQPADSDVTWTATAPAQVTALWVNNQASVLNFVVDLTNISVNLPVSRDLEITCLQVGGPYTITLDTDEWPIDPATGAPWADPVPGNNNDTTNVDVTCEAAAEEVDLAKADLYIKPFYCGDSDMDGDEATGAKVDRGTGTCCDGADNDGDTTTDGQDPKCGPHINEDPIDGTDDDEDGFYDEDPISWPSGQGCPWNGDDDCQGGIDEDPKNGEDDDGDHLIDEDPANGFLGIDNDRDGHVDEDGSGRFDWDGDTDIDEVQLEGVDDDGDTQVDEDPLDSPVGEPPTAHEPHYLIKELLRSVDPVTVTADVTTEIDAPAWRADAMEDGFTTCNDGLDNDLDGGCDAIPDFCWPGSEPDDQCLDEHIGEEESGLHSCNDGLDNGSGFETPGDGLIDELDPECETLTEASVECKYPDDRITVADGVPWYIKPRSDNPVLNGHPQCGQYYDPDHTNKCVPCKIYQGVGPVDDICESLVWGPGECIAVDSVPGVYKELDLHQQVELPYVERNLHLEVPPDIWDPAALGDPMGSAWRELYPNYSAPPGFNWIVTSWEDNDLSEDLSVDDQIDMTDAFDEKTWFHVDEITATVCLDDPSLPGLEMMCIESIGPFNPYDPFGLWHEKMPILSEECMLWDWQDNGDGFLSFCDYIILECPSTGIYEWHVLDVAMDIWVSEKVLHEHQFDLSCEGEVGEHKFIIQNEIQPSVGVDPNQANNELEMELLVECRSCTQGLDSDLDGFNDDVECYLPTDPTDDCPDVVGMHDAWPLDNNADTYVTVVPDILAYRGRVNTTGGPPPDPMWMQRLDLNADNFITVVPDILYYRGVVNTGC